MGDQKPCIKSYQEGQIFQVIAAMCSTKNAMHLDAQPFDGWPLLFDFLNDLECVETLIRHGAKIDVMANAGKNAFHHACIQGEHGALEVMLNMADSSDPSITEDNHGNTPLVDASQAGQRGPSHSKDDWSPIHYATKIHDGNPELLHAICRHRSFKKSAKTLDGKQAKVVAMEAGTWNGKIKELILGHDYLDWDD